MASRATERATEYVNDARYRARQTTRRAQSSFDRVLRENPLALGAAATLIGAAIGMTLPATEAENELMGDARDTVVDRARGMASDAAERVQNAAEQVKDVASKTADAARPGSSGSRPNTGGSRPDTSSSRPADRSSTRNRPGGLRFRTTERLCDSAIVRPSSVTFFLPAACSASRRPPTSLARRTPGRTKH